MIRTSVPKEALQSEETVSAYQGLSQVEWAFRSLKTVDLHMRPIFPWKDARIRARVFLCMLADLATLRKSKVRWVWAPNALFERVTVPTDVQRRVFELLGLTKFL